MARITNTHEGNDGYVRSCELVTSTRQQLTIHKLVLLLENENDDDGDGDYEEKRASSCSNPRQGAYE